MTSSTTLPPDIKLTIKGGNSIHALNIHSFKQITQFSNPLCESWILDVPYHKCVNIISIFGDCTHLYSWFSSNIVDKVQKAHSFPAYDVENMCTLGCVIFQLFSKFDMLQKDLHYEVP